ncbi:hypothetical protein E4U02_01165 [Microbacterium paludicola]|uniref:Uncharacterized protein n=1 Tax=Microbacterium paludicola TaxID=300019 RepID=A0A4Y9FYS2_9MICO|nr:hypothetical protein [Microbacterium paludicola]MBF0815018.1 hypothetical protein [Microbacterium paludicola]TFU34298.1 hypothetical protein E4U02_01165 [Microbacterium paludicola]
MSAGGALGAITEILSWVGIGAAVLFGVAALIVRLADGAWQPVRGVVIDDVVRWFGDDGVHEAPLTPELRAAATRDELDLFHRIGTRDVVRLHRHSPWPRLLGGVALACGTVGVIAVIVQIAAMILAD